MKTLRLLAFATLFLSGFAGTVGGRLVAVLSYQELVDKSDLVVIATPTATTDTKEYFEIIGQHVMGVETKFTVLTVLKGDKTPKDFLLHHYRTPDGSNFPSVPNGPSFVSFTPAADPAIPARTYLLFLIKEADGRYAPVMGQTDPGGAVKELRGVGGYGKGKVADQ